MTISLKQRAALAAGLCCLLAGIVVAQQVVPGQSDRTTQPRPGEGQQLGAGLREGANADVDRYLANCWSAHNQAEIQISQVAEQKAENPEVKQFAQKMIEEHTALARKLQPLAGGQVGEEGSYRTDAQSSTAPQPGQPGQPAVAGEQRQPGQPGRIAGQTGAGGRPIINRIISIEKQIVDRSTELMRQKLDEKSGAEFDQCYVTGQIACHMQASAALGVVSQQASGQLKQLASQAKQTVDHHLQEAEQLAEQLKGQSPAGRQAGAFRDRNIRPARAQE